MQCLQVCKFAGEPQREHRHGIDIVSDESYLKLWCEIRYNNHYSLPHSLTLHYRSVPYYESVIFSHHAFANTQSKGLFSGTSGRQLQYTHFNIFYVHGFWIAL